MERNSGLNRDKNKATRSWLKMASPKDPQTHWGIWWYKYKDSSPHSNKELCFCPCDGEEDFYVVTKPQCWGWHKCSWSRTKLLFCMITFFGYTDLKSSYLKQVIQQPCGLLNSFFHQTAALRFFSVELKSKILMTAQWVKNVWKILVSEESESESLSTISFVVWVKFSLATLHWVWAVIVNQVQLW